MRPLKNTLIRADGDDQCHCKAILNQLWKAMVVWGSFWGLEKSKCHFYFQEVKKGDPENFRLFILTSVPLKVMEQINLENISKDMKDNKVIGRSLHGFMKRKFNV